jgi:hypothetical protein
VILRPGSGGVIKSLARQPPRSCARAGSVRTPRPPPCRARGSMHSFRLPWPRGAGTHGGACLRHRPTHRTARGGTACAGAPHSSSGRRMRCHRRPRSIAHSPIHRCARCWSNGPRLARYLRHRLAHAGRTDPLFGNDAFSVAITINSMPRPLPAPAIAKPPPGTHATAAGSGRHLFTLTGSTLRSGSHHQTLELVAPAMRLMLSRWV